MLKERNRGLQQMVADLETKLAAFEQKDKKSQTVDELNAKVAALEKKLKTALTAKAKEAPKAEAGESKAKKQKVSSSPADQKSPQKRRREPLEDGLWCLPQKAAALLKNPLYLLDKLEVDADGYGLM